MTIRIYGTGCSKCQQLAEAVKNVALRVKGVVAIEKVTAIEKIVARGVVATPALEVEDEIVATGRKIPEWTLQDGEPAALQESPVATDAPEETIRFIPMGAARCRLTVLPVAAERGDIATRWQKVPATTRRTERPQLITQ